MEATRRFRLCLVASLIALLANPATPAAAPASTSPPLPYCPNSIIVRFKPSARALALSAAGLHPGDPVIAHAVAHSVVSASASAAPAAAPAALAARANVYRIVDGSSVEDKVAALRALPDVALAEPNYRVQALRQPSDSRYTSQWHLPIISAPAAWDAISSAAEVKVCVLDTGARMDHPDLAANIIKGWNVIGGAAVAAVELPNWNDTDVGHGTHVAGLVGALGNNARGVSGVAWRVGLLICRFIGPLGGDIFDAMVCMRLCRDEGALIYNNSWGGLTYSSRALLDEIEALAASNGTFIAAAGNGGSNLDLSPRYPASFGADNQITVAATTSSDELAEFSDYGRNSVDLAAPGEHLLSTLYDGGYGHMSGTSMATPVVSGAAALLQAVAVGATGAPLTPARLKRLLMDTGDAFPFGARVVTSGKRINVASAVAALSAELGGYTPAATPPLAPAPAPLPQVPRPPPSNVSAPPPDSGAAVVLPECGTSALRGAAANQSSVAAGSAAGNAVNGDCRNDMASLPGACAATDPALSNPWWTAPLAGGAEAVLAVGLTPRADCCWNALGGAIVMVGNGTWAGPSSSSSFSECGRVPTTDGVRGQRVTVRCAAPVWGSRVVVYLPKIKTSLALCEVDVALGGGAAAPVAVAPVATTPVRRLLGSRGVGLVSDHY